MRKILTLAMASLLALSVVIAAVGCAPKQEEAPATETHTESVPMDTTGGSMMGDTLASDTTMSH